MSIKLKWIGLSRHDWLENISIRSQLQSGVMGWRGRDSTRERGRGRERESHGEGEGEGSEGEEEKKEEVEVEVEAEAEVEGEGEGVREGEGEEPGEVRERWRGRPLNFNPAFYHFSVFSP